jgi:hypothetical protein
MSRRGYDRAVVAIAIVIIGFFFGRAFRPAEAVARWMLNNARPQVFRVHHSDVRDWNLANEPKRIRCPECGGTPPGLQGIDKWTGQPIFCRSCGVYGTVDVRSLLLPVVIVADGELTDYQTVR